VDEATDADVAVGTEYLLDVVREDPGLQSVLRIVSHADGLVEG
jgi:hypothetical protein